MPLGAICAQITHAAGESARLAPELPADTHAVVLGVPDETALLEVAARLSVAGIRYVLVREPDMGGAATAIGCCPGDRKPLRKPLSNLPLVK